MRLFVREKKNKKKIHGDNKKEVSRRILWFDLKVRKKKRL
jgi:hypothetical protein